VLAALCVNEPNGAIVGRWYAACRDELICAASCVTEFASALGIKQRTSQIDGEQSARAWQSFERLCAGDVQLLPIEQNTFHRAAVLTLDATMGLRAGDARHFGSRVERQGQEHGDAG